MLIILEINKIRFGKDHIEFSISLQNLSLILISLGNFM
jgi:hypothetical protein